MGTGDGIAILLLLQQTLSYLLSSRSPLLTSLQRTTCREHTWFSTVLASNFSQLFLAQPTELVKEGT